MQVDFSRNNFTSLNSYKRFKRSHKTLRVLDISNNFVRQDLSELMTNMPPNMERLVLSENQIYGTLPESLENLAYLRQLELGTNMLTGELPDFSTSFPNLQVLNLANQNRGNNTGLTGSIPESLTNLPFLTTLNLGGNSLTSTIPPLLSNLGLLKILDLSKNRLSSLIPASLGKLDGQCLSSRLSLALNFT